MVWAATSVLTFVILRLGAQDTPATPWAGAAPSWEEHMRFWDAGWYNRIVEEGYPDRLPVGADGRVTQNTWAFMPLLSGLASLLGWTGWSFYVRATIVSILASAAAAVVMDRWLSPLTGRRSSLWAVALVWSSPCAAVLQAPYAESLGLVLVGLTLWLASRGQALAATPLALAACFARPVGVPLGAALGLWWLWETACARSWVPPTWFPRLLPGHSPHQPALVRRGCGGSVHVSDVFDGFVQPPGHDVPYGRDRLLDLSRGAPLGFVHEVDADAREASVEIRGQQCEVQLEELAENRVGGILSAERAERIGDAGESVKRSEP